MGRVTFAPLSDREGSVREPSMERRSSRRITSSSASVSVESLGLDGSTAVNTPIDPSSSSSPRYFDHTYYTPNTIENDYGRVTNRHNDTVVRDSPAVGAVEGLEREMKVEDDVDAGSNEKHRNMNNGKDGVREKKQMVDLGNGMEEVVVIHWLPGDPDVSRVKSTRSRYDAMLT